MDQDKKFGIVFFIISFVLHGAVFGGMLAFQDFSFPKPLPPVIQVDLVSFDPQPLLEDAKDDKTTAKKGEASLKAKPIKSKPKKIKHIKPDISLKTKPKNLKELIEKEKQKKEKPPEKKPEKKEPIKPQDKPEEKAEPSKAQEKAADEPDKKIEDGSREKIAEALSRLQKTVQEQGKEKGKSASGTASGKGRRSYKPIDMYKMVLGATIQQNWVYTDILAGMNKNLEVRILIKILKSGEIRDIIYETKSGNRYLDESAKKAIKKSNPLPELPKGMRSYDVVVIFTPEGLR